MKVQATVIAVLTVLVAAEATRPLTQQPPALLVQAKTGGHGGGGGVGEGKHSGMGSPRGRLLLGAAAGTKTRNADNTAPAAPTAPNSLQERSSWDHYGGWGGGGGGYGPSSYYFSPGSASSRFDFGSMWAGGARKLRDSMSPEAAAAPLPASMDTPLATTQAAQQPATSPEAATKSASLQERAHHGGHGGHGYGGHGGGWGGGGGGYGPSSYYFSPGSASSRFDFGSMWAGGARKLQTSMSPGAAAAPLPASMDTHLATTQAAQQPAAAPEAATKPASLQERGLHGGHGWHGYGGHGGGWGGGGGGYGPSSYYYRPMSAGSRFDIRSMWAGGARKLQTSMSPEAAAAPLPASMKTPPAAPQAAHQPATSPEAATKPASRQERAHYGGHGYGGYGGGWGGGGGGYGPSSYYFSPGSASSRFDFGSMWAGGARKLQGAAGGAVTSSETAKAANQPAASDSLQERSSWGHHGGWHGGGGGYGPNSYYYRPMSASSRFNFGSMWAGGARKLQGAAGVV